MDHHIKEYYREASGKDTTPGTFHKVVHLHEDSRISWKEAEELAPTLPRGWFELSRLSQRDRVDFCRDFWISRFPFHPHLGPLLTKFFASLDDICLLLLQRTFDTPAEPKLVYSLRGDNGFFQGSPPIEEDEVLSIFQKDFPSVLFPQDYLAFLSIHNGFGKLSDTGVLQAASLKETYRSLYERLEVRDPLFIEEGVALNPKHLYPFYESFGTRCYQCFLEDWYPDQEMGNVYYSEMTKTLSPIGSSLSSAETLAFPTFADWLFFYLERIG